MPTPGTGILNTGRIDGVDDVVPVVVPRPNVRVTGNAPTQFARVLQPVRLYHETAMGSNEFAAIDGVDWQRILRSMDGADTTATLTTGLDAEDLTTAGSIGTRHYSHLIETLSPDRRVRIAQTWGAGTPQVYFQGWPMVARLGWEDRRQALSWLCADEGQELIRTTNGAQVFGRYMRWSPLTDWSASRPDISFVESEPTVFNAGNRPNRSVEAYPFDVGSDTFKAHLFLEDGAPEASYWSYADALRYLILFHCMRPAIGVSARYFMIDTDVLSDIAPVRESPDPFVRRITERVEGVSVAGMNLDEALAQLTQAAGLHYEIAIYNVALGSGIDVEHRLRLFATLAKSDDGPSATRLMGVPEVRTMPREAPFTDMTGRAAADALSSNRAVSANLSCDRRVINAPLILAGRKWYEVTLLMRPGWLPHEDLDNLFDDETEPEDIATARAAALAIWEDAFDDPEYASDDTRMPRSVYHGSHPDHHTVKNIGRLWIFPDDARYVTRGGDDDDGPASTYARVGWPAQMYWPYNPAQPENLVYVHSDLGGGLADSANWVPRRRPLRNIIGRTGGTSDQAPIVRVNFAAPNWGQRFAFNAADWSGILNDPNWVRYTGGIHVDADRAAITLTEANLLDGLPLLADPTDAGSMRMLEAYIYGHFAVAVTCTIAGDDRLRRRGLPTGGPLSRIRHRVVDAGLERFEYRSQGEGNSHLFASAGSDADPAFRTRDDTGKLTAFAAREGEICVGETVAGSIAVPWIDRTYKLGDSFSGINGLGISFNRYPEAVRREYFNDGQAGQRTVVHVSDLRDAPEVDHE